MTKYVKSIDEVTAYIIPEPKRTLRILVDSQDGAKWISLGLCILDPNSEIPYHNHEDAEEVMYIFKGRGKAIIDGVEYELKENTSMYCPAKIMHQIVNPNPSELWFVFAYAPPGAEQSIRTRGIPVTK
ncbi:MAG: cupin domain-containing protein [Candidatus Bathyarchaeia archaeon]